MTAFVSRRERFTEVGSTNDVVRDWLAAGTPEVCVAVADVQTAGRGRAGRRWVAPAGAALLLSAGFRPSWLAPDRTWRLAAIASLAMADAVETTAGLPSGTVRQKWPNDLVVERPGAGARKLAGVLGETDGLGTADPRVVLGLGINTAWHPDAFPPDLAGTMTSLQQLAPDRVVSNGRLADAFLARLEPATEALRVGSFDEDAWGGRQVTTGRVVDLVRPEGTETVRAAGVDPATGALLVEDGTGATRRVLVGEISHVRLAAAVAEPV